VLVRNYVSCINPNGKAGLYDMVEGTFEGNAGTGEFIAGDTRAFVGYVTADDENSYPNSGELDGYWYEKVEGGTPYTGANPLTIGEAGATIPANTLLETALQIVNGVQAGMPIPYGFSKFAVDKFTHANKTNIYVSGSLIKHSLGVVPKAIIIIGTPASNASVDIVSRIIADPNNSTSYAWSAIGKGDSTGHNHKQGSVISLSSTGFALSYTGNSNFWFGQGVTYTMITLA
jgi:hypothetical protein